MAGFLIKEAPPVVRNDMKKSRSNLNGLLRIAAAPTFPFPIFFQGFPGPMGTKGSVGRPGLLGKKVNVTFYRFQILREKKFFHSFHDFHVNSS